MQNGSSQAVGYLPVRCIEKVCPRFEVLLYDPKQKQCTTCGSDLYPVLRELPQVSTIKAGLPPQKQDDTFTCPSAVSGCPIASKPKVEIPLDLFNKWVWLAESFDTEWIAYLKGSHDTVTDTYTIESMYLPRQKASKMTCEAEENQIQPGTIGSIHSHVDMDVFFSAEDIRHANHPVELVINRKGEIKSNCLSKLKCGELHRGEGELLFTNCDEELELSAELDGKINVQEDITPAQIKGWQRPPII